jgi:hypothetical protein
MVKTRNAVDHGKCPGEVGVRETLIGFVLVSVLAGIVLGRNTERARRNYKDWGAAKAAVPKGRQLAMQEMRKAAFTIIIVGGLLAVLFIGAATFSGN